MTLPFSSEEFFQLFATYNVAIWPVQIVVYAVGLAAVGALWAAPPIRERVVLAVLAMLWAWNGVAYQARFFATINPAARLFAVLFVLQAILFAAAAVTRAQVHLRVGRDSRTLLAAALIAYALLVYEALGHLAGHGGLEGPLFGVAPCPTTIFTIGMLLLAHGPVVIWLSIVPLMWALIGASAALLLGVPQDLGLAVAALALLAAIGTDYWRTIVELQLPPDDDAVAAHFASERETIREAQSGSAGYTYKGSCRKPRVAGCAGYFVSFLRRRVVYFGRTGETHIEHFPSR